jgi:NAD/NADP transhydrogenase beta subunit
MNKFKFLAWIGAVWNFWQCSASIDKLFAGSWFPWIVDFGLEGAGLTLCIGLIQKKSSALPKARLLLLITAGWYLVVSVARYFMNEIPEIRANMPAFVGFVVLTIAVNLVLWKIWGSDEAANYANSQAS